MKIEEQVLSIKQIQELQELGFDVEKYASMCWFEQTPFAPIEQPKKYELEILTYSLMGNRGYLEVIPTLTIGDIIDVLPFNIDTIFFTREKGMINNLFNTLVWCIKEKHIKL